MEYTWSRAFADGREAALLGGSAERLLDACERLSLERARFVSGFVEAPLLGAPEYDALVIHNPGFLVPGCRIADTAQQKAQEVLDWAAAMGEIRPYIHFELDAAGSGTLSGIHCRIEGRLDWAEGFFRVVGEPHRTEAFVRNVRRLPEGWFCRYTGIFPGRQSNNTRMEVKMLNEAARHALCDVAYLRQCFDRIGFEAYDEPMLQDITRLASVDVPISIQFDFLPDGSFLPVLSFLSLYENVRPNCAPLFALDGGLRHTCQIYEEMGVSDDRWQMLEPCCFSAKRAFQTREGVELRFNHCFPCCTKAKWIGAERTPAKFYLLLDEQRVPYLPEEQKST